MKQSTKSKNNTKQVFIETVHYLIQSSRVGKSVASHVWNSQKGESEREPTLSAGMVITLLNNQVTRRRDLSNCRTEPIKQAVKEKRMA